MEIVYKNFYGIGKTNHGFMIVIALDEGKIMTNRALVLHGRQLVSFMWSAPKPWFYFQPKSRYFKIHNGDIYIGKLCIAIGPTFRNRKDDEDSGIPYELL